MREGITVEVSAADRARLEAVVADRDGPQEHAWRARIVLATAAGLGTNAIVRRAGVSKPCVRRGQARFMAEGLDRLLRDKTRPPGTPPLPRASVERGVEPTRQAPPGEVTPWTGRAMAKAVGISLSAVRGIWKAHGLVPHRVRTFKLSRDPEFIARLRDVVGLYMDPPAHARGRAVGGREEPDPGAGPHPAGATDEAGPVRDRDPRPRAQRNHHAVRGAERARWHGAGPLRCMQRHRHQEFLRFLNAVEAAVPAGKLVHAILDNYATHKHPKVRAWLARHPRWTFHFVPTSCSWLNAVETFFAKLTRRRLRRGSCPSLVALQEAINRFVEEANEDPRPFVWTAEPDGIIEKVRRGCQAFRSVH